MFGGSQGNNFYWTENGGSTWGYAGNLITGSGPFINRVSNPYQDPDVLYVVSNYGVNKSSDFGKSWNLNGSDSLLDLKIYEFKKLFFKVKSDH